MIDEILMARREIHRSSSVQTNPHLGKRNLARVDSSTRPWAVVSTLARQRGLELLHTWKFSLPGTVDMAWHSMLAEKELMSRIKPIMSKGLQEHGQALSTGEGWAAGELTRTIQPPGTLLGD